MQPVQTAQSNREYFDQLLDEQQAAGFLRFSVRALQNWRVRGGGPDFVKATKRSVRYRRRDLLNWAEKNLRSNTSAVSVSP